MQSSEKILEHLRFCDNVLDEYQAAKVELQRMEQLTQDLLHKLELEDPSYHEAARIGRELIHVRRERRPVKDTMTILEPLAGWLMNKNGRSYIAQLKQVYIATRKREENLRNRSYHPRILKDPVEDGIRLEAKNASDDDRAKSAGQSD